MIDTLNAIYRTIEALAREERSMLAEIHFLLQHKKNPRRAYLMLGGITKSLAALRESISISRLDIEDEESVFAPQYSDTIEEARRANGKP